MQTPPNKPETTTTPTPAASPFITPVPASAPIELLSAFKPDRNLADFYLSKLSKIAAEEITLDAAQANAVLGVELCQELSVSVFTMKTDMMGRKKKSRSLIPPEKRVAVSGLIKFKRLEFLEAIRKVTR